MNVRFSGTHATFWWVSWFDWHLIVIIWSYNSFILIYFFYFYFSSVYKLYSKVDSFILKLYLMILVGPKSYPVIRPKCFNHLFFYSLREFFCIFSSLKTSWCFLSLLCSGNLPLTPGKKQSREILYNPTASSHILV